jgi:K+-sensing histidine kinase KdpD
MNTSAWRSTITARLPANREKAIFRCSSAAEGKRHARRRPGLAICRAIVQAHGGVVGQTRPGGGAR